MLKNLFNRTKTPGPKDIKAFCDAATQGDDKAGLVMEKFIQTFGKDAIDLPHPDTGYTALMCAARHGQAENCAALLNSGANVNAQDKDGWTALIVAVNHKRQDVVKTLLDHKADINLANDSGITPLMVAAREADEDLVRLLIARGADRLCKNNAQQDAAAVARSYSTGPADIAHARVASLLDAEISTEQKAVVERTVAQIAEDFKGGTLKPVSVSRPIVFRT